MRPSTVLTINGTSPCLYPIHGELFRFLLQAEQYGLVIQFAEELFGINRDEDFALIVEAHLKESGSLPITRRRSEVASMYVTLSIALLNLGRKQALFHLANGWLKSMGEPRKNDVRITIHAQENAESCEKLQTSKKLHVSHKARNLSSYFKRGQIADLMNTFEGTQADLELLTAQTCLLTPELDLPLGDRLKWIELVFGIKEAVGDMSDRPRIPATSTSMYPETIFFLSKFYLGIDRPKASCELLQDYLGCENDSFWSDPDAVQNLRRRINQDGYCLTVLHELLTSISSRNEKGCVDALQIIDTLLDGAPSQFRSSKYFNLNDRQLIAITVEYLVAAAAQQKFDLLISESSWLREWKNSNIKNVEAKIEDWARILGSLTTCMDTEASSVEIEAWVSLAESTHLMFWDSCSAPNLSDPHIIREWTPNSAISPETKELEITMSQFPAFKWEEGTNKKVGAPLKKKFSNATKSRPQVTRKPMNAFQKVEQFNKANGIFRKHPSPCTAKNGVVITFAMSDDRIQWWAYLHDQRGQLLDTKKATLLASSSQPRKSMKVSDYYGVRHVALLTAIEAFWEPIDLIAPELKLLVKASPDVIRGNPLMMNRIKKTISQLESSRPMLHQLAEGIFLSEESRRNKNIFRRPNDYTNEKLKILRELSDVHHKVSAERKKHGTKQLGGIEEDFDNIRRIKGSWLDSQLRQLTESISRTIDLSELEKVNLDWDSINVVFRPVLHLHSLPFSQLNFRGKPIWQSVKSTSISPMLNRRELNETCPDLFHTRSMLGAYWFPEKQWPHFTGLHKMYGEMQQLCLQFGRKLWGLGITPLASADNIKHAFAEKGIGCAIIGGHGCSKRKGVELAGKCPNSC